MFLLVIIGIALSLSSLPSLELGAYYLGLLTIFVLLWRRSRELALPRGLVYLLIFPLLLFCVTLHGIYGHPARDFFKDLWYFTLAIVYLSFGYLAFERVGCWQRFVQPMLIAGGGIAVFSVINAVIHRDSLANASSVDAYREVTGTGTFIPMLPLILVLLLRRSRLSAMGLERWKTMRVFFYVSSTIAILITFSRTHILMLAAGALCTLQWRSAVRRVVGGGGIGLLLALVALIGAGSYLAQAKSGPLNMFMNKVVNSSSEVKVRAYETFSDINNHWRGFEAYRAEKTYAAYSTGDKIFGGGGGALVDLGIAMQLSSTQAFKYIPITHNGYMYLLVKTGVCGLCLFALFILQLLATSWKALRLRTPEATFAGLALLWTPLVIVATQGVITGIFNKGELMPVLFLTGAAVASYSQAAAKVPKTALHGLPSGRSGRPVRVRRVTVPLCHVLDPRPVLGSPHGRAHGACTSEVRSGCSVLPSEVAARRSS